MPRTQTKPRLLKPKRDSAIVTTHLPMLCPACAYADQEKRSESGGITRMTCPRCEWTERYRVTG